ncbi:MAG: hypothetical protein KGV44_10890 [Flavobacteriaceae bacterium]|nr:hypothetical protein [Flavobacteriaceae bacterium]
MEKKKIQWGTKEDIRKMHEQMKKEDYWKKRKEEGKKKYQKYAPFFENLYENKIVYHERITRIVRLEDLEVTEEGFRAKAIQEKVILSKFQQERCRKLNTLEKVRNSPRQWTFSGTWEGAIISEKPLSIAMPYVSFVLWIEPDLVKYIEKLAEYGDDEDALKILWNR